MVRAMQSRKIVFLKNHAHAGRPEQQTEIGKGEESKPKAVRGNTGETGKTMRNNAKTPKSGIAEAPNPSKKGPNSPIPA